MLKVLWYAFPESHVAIIIHLVYIVQDGKEV